MAIYDGIQIELIAGAGSQILEEADLIARDVLEQLEVVFSRGIDGGVPDKEKWATLMRMLAEISVVSQGISARCKEMMTMIDIVRDLCRE